MALDLPNTYVEKSPHKETLSNTQEAVVNKVLSALESPELNKKISGLFSNMFDQVAGNGDLFAKLMKSA